MTTKFDQKLEELANNHATLCQKAFPGRNEQDCLVAEECYKAGATAPEVQAHWKMEGVREAIAALRSESLRVNEPDPVRTGFEWGKYLGGHFGIRDLGGEGEGK